MMMIMVRKNPSLHPSLSMPTLRLCSCRTDNLKPTCCVTGPAKARRSLPTRERTVSAPSYMISTMQPRFPTMTVREPSSSSFTISEVFTECLLQMNCTNSNAGSKISSPWVPRSFPFKVHLSRLRTHCLSYPCHWLHFHRLSISRN